MHYVRATKVFDRCCMGNIGGLTPIASKLQSKTEAHLREDLGDAHEIRQSALAREGTVGMNKICSWAPLINCEWKMPHERWDSVALLTDNSHLIGDFTTTVNPNEELFKKAGEMSSSSDKFTEDPVKVANEDHHEKHWGSLKMLGKMSRVVYWTKGEDLLITRWLDGMVSLSSSDWLDCSSE